MSAAVRNSSSPCGPTSTAISQSSVMSGRLDGGAPRFSAACAGRRRGAGRRRCASARPAYPPNPPSVNVEALPSTGDTSMPPRTSRYARTPGGPIASMPTIAPAATSIALPHRERPAVDVRRRSARPRGTPSHAVWNSRRGPLAVSSSPGDAFGVPDDPIPDPERQVVHRPARRDADRPVSEPARMVLHGAERPAGEHLDRATGGRDAREQRRREARGARSRDAATTARRRSRFVVTPSMRVASSAARSRSSASARRVAVRDHLGEQRVVVGGDSLPGLHPRVDAGVVGKRHRA